MCKDIWRFSLGLVNILDMCVNMSKTIQEERLRWILPIAQKQVRLIDVVKMCPYSQRSLERWLRSYRQHGKKGLIPLSTSPQRSPGETPIRIKEMVVERRKKTNLCAQKIHWRLKKEGFVVPVRTIGKIIKKEGLTRKYRIKKVKYKYIRAERQPGDMIEIDVKYVPGRIKGRRYYQYTAVDTASRWRYLRIFDEQSNSHSVVFLQDVLSRFRYPIKAVKTDNGAVFTNRYVGAYTQPDLSPRKLHLFDLCCARHNIIHYLIDPGKPAQNGTVERSHREDQEKFYDQNTFHSLQQLETGIRIWNEGYNNMEHCSLNGKTPLEFLREYQLKNSENIRLRKPTKVLA